MIPLPSNINFTLNDENPLLCEAVETCAKRANALDAALEIANRSADDQMFQKREAERQCEKSGTEPPVSWTLHLLYKTEQF